LTLLTHYAVFPPFFDLLHTFGRKSWEKKENFGIYKQHLQGGGSIPPSSFRKLPHSQISLKLVLTDSPLPEICYNLKYAELRPDNMLDSKSLAWTTRKTGIWANYEHTTRRTVWIVLQPSNSFKRRLNSLVAGMTPRAREPLSFMDIHRLQLSCAAEDTEDYISELERNFHELVCRS
jgi:hypothetical protein